MCTMFDISRSAYYDWNNNRVGKEQLGGLEELVQKEFEKSKHTYGSPRICKALNNRGVAVSKSTVARAMKSLGIQARPRRKYVTTTDSTHNYLVFENILNRNFTSQQPNEKWTSDITYIPTELGWTYLTVILDLADKMIVAWTLSKNMAAKNTSSACLKLAIQRRKLTTKLIFHSDRGVQYCCQEFQELIKANNQIVQSMSRKGNCWDNAPTESFFKTLKQECIHKSNFKNIYEARKSIFDYIERWYNTKRKHSALEYKSPLQYHYFLTHNLT